MSRIQLSAISTRFRHIWFRNLITYRRIWRVNFLVPLLEPGFILTEKRRKHDGKRDTEKKPEGGTT